MSKKVLAIGLTVAGFALMAIPGIGTALGMGAISLAGVGLTGSIAVASLVGFGLTIAGSVLMGPAKPKALHTSPSDRLTATLDPTAPRKIVFGRTALGNDVRYQAFTGPNQEYLDQIIVHASHEVESIDELWIGNELAWTASAGAQGRYAGYLEVTPRTVGTSTNGIAIDGTWTAACTLTGCAYSRARFKLTGNSSKAESPFSTGVDSRTTWRGKGAKLYNPRLDSTVEGGAGSHRADDQFTWTWDDNACRSPALQELFYELGWRINGKLAVGKGVPPARMDLPSFAVAANACDESVAKNGGGTEPRYRSDGVISEADDPSAVRGQLCATMNAQLSDAGGKLSLTVLHDDLATPITPFGRSAFDQSDVLGPIQWSQTPDLSATFNVVRGRRVDPSNTALYQMVEVPEVRIDSPDGIDRIDTFELPFVESNGQAQRLFKQRLQRNQFQGTLKFTGGPAFWGVSLGKVVPITLPTFGWTEKLFRCAAHKQNRGGPVELVFVEESPLIYQWDNDEAPAVTPGTPTIYDPLNDPLIGGIADAGGTATWSGVVDDGGKPEDNATHGADLATNVSNANAQHLPYGDGTPVETLKPAEAGAEVTTGKSITVLTGRNLDNIADTGTRAAVLATRVNAGRPVVDLSETIHANVNLDYVGETASFKKITDPQKTALTTALDTTTNVGQIKTLPAGDSNRVRFSRFEAGTKGWTTRVNTSGNAVALATGLTNGRAYINSTGTFTAAGQSVSICSDFAVADYRIPVTAAERLYVGALPRISAMPAGSSWVLIVSYLDQSGLPVDGATQVVGSGTALLSPEAFREIFTNANVAGYFAFLELTVTSGAAGAFSFSLFNPMLCGAGASQTARPPFTPGPASELGATLGATAGPGGNLSGDVDGNKRPHVDLAQAGHLNKNLDNIANGSTYSRMRGSALAADGRRLADTKALPPLSAMNLGYRFTGDISYSALSGSPATATISVTAGSMLGTGVSYSAMSVGVTGFNGLTIRFHLYVQENDDPTTWGGSKTLVAVSNPDTVYGTNRAWIGTVDVAFPNSGSGSGSGVKGGGGGGGAAAAVGSVQP